jgi:hypothetical protein
VAQQKAHRRWGTGGDGFWGIWGWPVLTGNPRPAGAFLAKERARRSPGGSSHVRFKLDRLLARPGSMKCVEMTLIRQNCQYPQKTRRQGEHHRRALGAGREGGQSRPCRLIRAVGRGS